MNWYFGEVYLRNFGFVSWLYKMIFVFFRVCFFFMVISFGFLGFVLIKYMILFFMMVLFFYNLKNEGLFEKVIWFFD